MIVTKEYIITTKKQLKALSHLFTVTILIFALLVYYQYNSELDEWLAYWVIIFLISLAPVVFLHLEYLMINNHYKFIINIEKGFFELYNTKRREESIIKFYEVEKIVIYCAPSVWKKKNFKFLPFENYHFSRIFTKDHKQYVVTSLLMEDIVDGFKIVPDIEFKFKLRIFATTLTIWNNQVN